MKYLKKLLDDFNKKSVPNKTSAIYNGFIRQRVNYTEACVL